MSIKIKVTHHDFATQEREFEIDAYGAEQIGLALFVFIQPRPIEVIGTLANGEVVFHQQWQGAK